MAGLIDDSCMTHSSDRLGARLSCRDLLVVGVVPTYLSVAVPASAAVVATQREEGGEGSGGQSLVVGKGCGISVGFKQYSVVARQVDSKTEDVGISLLHQAPQQPPNCLRSRDIAGLLVTFDLICRAEAV